jgi:hypothetical protein
MLAGAQAAGEQPVRLSKGSGSVLLFVVVVVVVVVDGQRLGVEVAHLLASM